ncbi:hypothetical protein L830_0419 [Mycobacteroides abscessus MAB_082312_2258]|nr:hypothetical protein L830_0419 [Mycobacteroides abscessus MAB_082312_2258]
MRTYGAGVARRSTICCADVTRNHRSVGIYAVSMARDLGSWLSGPGSVEGAGNSRYPGSGLVCPKAAPGRRRRSHGGCWRC